MQTVSEALLRIEAMMLRYLYLYRRSLARAGDIVFWPVMNLLVWGFVTRFLQEVTVSRAVLFLLGAIIFWDLLYRSQQAITLGMTEEIWVRNLINLFIAPIHTWEMIMAMCLVGVIRSIITTLLLAGLAWLFYAFDFLALGLALLPFFFNLLLFGWAVGLCTMALVLRYGHAAEALVWGVPFLIQPITAVFYPVSVLPGWLQKVAYCLPSTYVFEGMREIMAGHPFNVHMMLVSFGLNILYLFVGGFIFGWMLEKVKQLGLLARLNVE